MRKKLSFINFFLGILLLSPSIVSALPLYLTVEGEVGLIRSDSAGIITAAGITTGSKMNFSLVIDFERVGAVSLNNGAVAEYVDPYDRSIFYAEYLGGDMLQEKDGGIHNAATDVAQYNYGSPGFTSSQYPDPNWFEGFINLGSQNAWLSIWDILPSPDDWHVGGSFGFFSNAACDTAGNFSSLVGGPLYITSIGNSAPVPVPEPASIILLLVGLLACWWEVIANRIEFFYEHKIQFGSLISSSYIGRACHTLSLISKYLSCKNNWRRDSFYG